MKKFLFILAIMVMVTIPMAFAGENTPVTVTADVKHIKSATPDAITLNGYVLDLSNKTLTITDKPGGDDFVIAAYSVDGSKWKSGNPTAAQMAKMIDKGMKLSIASAYVDKNPAGYIVSFPTIKPAPKANPDKAKVVYGANLWELSTNGKLSDGKIVTSKYEFALTEDKKNPKSTPSSFDMDGSGEFALKALDDNGKPVKTVYLVRLAADTVTNTPASKWWKVTVSGYGKPVSAKPDYKKEIVKVKAGDWVKAAAASNTSLTDSDAVTEAAFKLDTVLDSVPAATANTPHYLLVVRPVPATGGKKPPTSPLKIELAPRATITAAIDLGVSKNKLSSSDAKPYEFKKVLTDAKWGKAPAIAQTTAVTDSPVGFARIKATAKAVKNSDGTIGYEDGKYAASKPGALKVTSTKDAETNVVTTDSAKIDVPAT